MGLRCLLGHDFGEPETEREREEAGNEVVVTVRDVKRCRRCGDTQVVSENKEVKSLDRLRERTAAGQRGSDPAGEGGAAGDATTAEASVETAADQGPDRDTVEDIIDAAEVDDTDPTDHPSVDDPPGEADVEDDAVIMDDDRDAAAGGDQFEPDPVDVAGDEAEPAPGGDEPSEPVDATDVQSGRVDDGDARPTGDDLDEADEDGDAMILEDDDAAARSDPASPPEDVADPGTPDAAETGDDADAVDAAGADTGDSQTDTTADEPGGGEATEDWPEHEGVDPADAEAEVEVGGGVEESTRRSNGADSRSEGPEFEGPGELVGRSTGGRTTVDLSQSATEAELQYHCPECGLTRQVGNSSMRAGDICPDCRRGYIEERTAE